ncbi:MAG: peptidoglycan-binding protein, partial [Patescibacteria group bacterium]|nr:peptidoglycan-binding protein [Patescibacteria group bacterium]
MRLHDYRGGRAIKIIGRSFMAALGLSVIFFSVLLIRSRVIHANTVFEVHYPYLPAQYVGSLPSLGKPPTPGNVLCLYNKNSPTSAAICTYYAAARPGVSLLGLDISDSDFGIDAGFTDSASRETMSYQNFVTDISQPIAQYVAANPNLYITELAIAKDLPIRVTGDPGSSHYAPAVSASIFYEMKSVPGASYADIIGGWMNDRSCIFAYQHFDPSRCTADAHGTKYLYAASFLTGQDLADIEKMIDKAQAPAPNLNADTWLIDLTPPSAQTYGGSLTHDYEPEVPWLTNTLQMFGISPSNVILNEGSTYPYITNGTIVGYGGMGVYKYNDQWWLSQQPAVQAPVANRAIIDVYESYFGYSTRTDDQLTTNQSTISQALQPTAFGGANYSRSFSGGIGTVNEPTESGLGYFSWLFASYASGMTFSESALFTDQIHGMAIGDPLMTLQDAPRAVSLAVQPPASQVQATVTNGCYYPRVNGMLIRQPDGSSIGSSEGNITLNWQKSSLNVHNVLINITGNAQQYALDPGLTTYTFGGDPTYNQGLSPGTYTISLSYDYGNAITSQPVSVQVVIPANECRRIAPSTGGSSSSAGSANASTSQSSVTFAAVPVAGSPLGQSPVLNGSAASPVFSAQPMQSTLYCHDFNADFGIGEHNLDVRALNTVLNATGFHVANSYSLDFTPATAQALQAFQARYGISQTGYAGPLTRRELNSLFGCTSRADAQRQPSSNSQLGISSAIPNQTPSSALSVSAAQSQALNYAGSSLGVVASDAILPQMVAAGAAFQPIGAFEVTACGQPVTVGRMHFGVNVSLPSGSAVTLGPLSNIVITDESGTIIAGPTTVQYQGYGSGYVFDMTGTINFPQGTHSYVIKATLPSNMPAGTIVNLTTYPSLDWMDAIGRMSNSLISKPDYGRI